MLSKPQNEPDGSRTARWESGSLASVLLTLAEALGKKKRPWRASEVVERLVAQGSPAALQINLRATLLPHLEHTAHPLR